MIKPRLRTMTRAGPRLLVPHLGFRKMRKKTRIATYDLAVSNDWGPFRGCPDNQNPTISGLH